MTVLWSSIARVIGPTPPGTGEIQAALGSTSSKRTSPTSPPSSLRWMPTSTTTAPSPTYSAPTISRLPAATMSTSARRVTADNSRVREWQSVTVAFSRRSSCASGLPTRFERPTTTASRPESSMPLRLRSWITPCGVHGRRLGRPTASRPALSGLRPSTSLAGVMLEIRGIESSPSGRGSWIKKPETAVSAFNRPTRSSSSSWETSAEKRWTLDSIPTSWLSRSLEATYVTEAGSSPTRITSSRTGTPRSFSPATCKATSERTSAAAILPSSIFATIALEDREQ
jgi:hypothetical protein